MIRTGILLTAMTLGLAACGGADPVTAKFAAQCKQESGLTEAQCNCVAEKVVSVAGADTVNKLMAAGEKAASGGMTDMADIPMEEAMKVATASMQAAQACNVPMM